MVRVRVSSNPNPTCQCINTNETEGLAPGTRAVLGLFHCTQTDVKVAPWRSTVQRHSILDLWHHKRSLVVDPHIQVVAPNKALLQGGGFGVCVCKGCPGVICPGGLQAEGGQEALSPRGLCHQWGLLSGLREVMSPEWTLIQLFLSHCLCLSLFPKVSLSIALYFCHAPSSSLSVCLSFSLFLSLSPYLYLLLTFSLSFTSPKGKGAD